MNRPPMIMNCVNVTQMPHQPSLYESKSLAEMTDIDKI